MNTLPVKWEAMRRSLDEVVREAMEVDSRVKSMRYLMIGLKKFGWRGLNIEWIINEGGEAGGEAGGEE